LLAHGGRTTGWVATYIESGIPLDAKLSYDLLLSISGPDLRCTTAP